MEKILIIDDNEYIRYTLTELLQDAGFDVCACEEGFKGIEELRRNSYGLVILDLKLPVVDGMEILKRVRKFDRLTPVIILTAFGDIKSAVEAMKQGAQDYITKPFDNENMILTIRKTLEMKYLNDEVKMLRKKVDDSYVTDDVIGESKVMKEILEQVKIVAPTSLTVLLEGESGTGKEVIAHLIHKKSDRADKPFIAVDCGAISNTLIESELFGYEKGAFTDAKAPKPGKFELSNGGTIFLDEISNLSDSNQMKLLRLIEDRKVTRLGANKPINLNVRIITATNMQLFEAVNKQLFRQDLFYRLNEFHINLPPLRERTDDIPYFIEHFIGDANKELNKNVRTVTRQVLNRLMQHSWPGNVRELRNVIRRAVLMANNEDIEAITISEVGSAHSDHSPHSSYSNSMSIEDSTNSLEKELIMKALNEAGGNKSKAAKILKMNERTFYRRLKKLGIL